MSDATPSEDPTIGDAPPEAHVLLSSNVYDKLKPIAQIWLPALALFYITIAPLWGLPKPDEVAGTIVALDLLLGSVLGIASRQYKNNEARFDGLVVVKEENEDVSSVNLKMEDLTPLAIEDEITLKVERRS